jgi:hypothetical protein
MMFCGGGRMGLLPCLTLVRCRVIVRFTRSTADLKDLSVSRNTCRQDRCWLRVSTSVKCLYRFCHPWRSKASAGAGSMLLRSVWPKIMARSLSLVCLCFRTVSMKSRHAFQKGRMQRHWARCNMDSTSPHSHLHLWFVSSLCLLRTSRARWRSFLHIRSSVALDRGVPSDFQIMGQRK